MKNRTLKTALITSALLTVTAAAASPAYSECGNKLWERSPSYTAIFGEQCDDGTKKNEGESGNGGTLSGCRSGIWACYIRSRFVGNGILEKYDSPDRPDTEWEECDDGNHISGDLCGADGMFEDVYQYGATEKERCGNFILDPNEGCDAGPMNVSYAENHNKGLCSDKCQPIQGRSEKGYTCTYNGNLCGNQVIDRTAGEECDLGIDNGKPGSYCSEFCTFRKYNPTFTPGRVESIGGGLSGGYLDVSGSSPVDVSTVIGDAASNELIKVSNRGRTIDIKDTDAEKQFSGIFRSGQDISDGIDVRYTMTPSQRDPNKKQKMWDNDAFGLVFGIKKGDATNANANYIMLSWRNDPNDGNGPNKGGTSNMEPNRCGGPVKGAQRGLHLYHIKGVPDYNELWQMKDCQNSGHITEIKTTEMNVDLAGKVKKWANPAYTFRTWYTWDLGIDWGGKNPALQMRADYSKQGLKVWVNFEKVIDIPAGPDWPTDGEWGFYVLGMDNLNVDFSGYRSRVRKPKNATSFTYPDENTTGSFCGFCGDGKTQLEVEGGGAKLEGCDDKNSLPGDGCTASCQVEPGWVCDTDAEPSQCFTGEITEPQADVTLGKANGIVISGTYDGYTPDRMVVSLEDNTGDEKCIGDATVDAATKTWTFTCNSNTKLATNTGYVAKVVMTKGNGKHKGVLEKTVTFNIDTDGPDFDITKPTADPVYVNRISGCIQDAESRIPPGSKPIFCNFPFYFGESHTNPVQITYTIENETTSKTVETNKAIKVGQSGNFILTPAPKALDTPHPKEGKYKLTFTATRNSVSSTRERHFYIDRTKPTYRATIFDSVSGAEVVDNGIMIASGGKIVLSGTVMDGVTPKGEDGGAPLMVKVLFNSSSNGGAGSEQVKEVDVDPTTGEYVVQFDQPASHSANDTYLVKTTVIDKAGNEAAEANVNTASNVLIDDGAVIAKPVVTFDPADGSSINKTSYTIRGKITPGFYRSVDFKYCEVDKATDDCVAAGVGTEGPLAVNYSAQNGTWVGIGASTLTDGQSYKVTVTVRQGAKTFVYTSIFTVDARDVSGATVAIAEPAGNEKLNICRPNQSGCDATQNGKVKVKVKVTGQGDGTSAAVKAGDEVKIKLKGRGAQAQDYFYQDIEDSCQLTATGTPNEFECEVYVLANPQGRHALGDSVDIVAKVVAPNKSETPEITKEDVAVGPQVKVTSPQQLSGEYTIRGTVDDENMDYNVTVMICEKDTSPDAAAKGNFCVQGTESQRVPGTRYTNALDQWGVDKAKVTAAGYTLENGKTYLVFPYAKFDNVSVMQPHNVGIVTFTDGPGDPNNPGDPGNNNPNGNGGTQDGTVIINTKGNNNDQVKGDKEKGNISVDVTGTNGHIIEVTVTGSNGIESTGSCTVVNGKCTATVPLKDAQGRELAERMTIRVTDTNSGKSTSKVGVKVDYSKGNSGTTSSSDEGVTSGGCGCTQSNGAENGLLALIFAALGLAVIRRRKED